MNNLPRLLITPGEPAGIGPDVTLKVIQKDWPAVVIAIADPTLLEQRAALLNLPLKIKLVDTTQALPQEAHQAGILNVLPIPIKNPVVPGKLDVLNAEYVLRSLEVATKLCLEHQAQAIITGPVNKAALLNAGIAFSGHTEFFALQSGVANTVMLFVLDKLKIALATTHIPLSLVPAAITKAHLQAVIKILREELQHKFNITSPKIAVCGLNPHAGEGGHLGQEEINVITPALDELRNENYQLIGPLPADTAFLPEHLSKVDAVLAMYHDQALPLIKHLGFDKAVNVTLGLPFVRTSVDHGTALDLAGSANTDAGSMQSALELALHLCRISAATPPSSNA